MFSMILAHARSQQLDLAPCYQQGPERLVLDPRAGCWVAENERKHAETWKMVLPCHEGHMCQVSGPELDFG